MQNITNSKNILTKTPTKDGSKTLFSNRFQQNYHSLSGAVSESKHVFIDAGLKYMDKNELTIFELGFGTGLNAILTYIQAEKQNTKINYYTIEKYPVEISDAQKLNYDLFFNQKHLSVFEKLHNLEWNTKNILNKNFMFKKIKTDFLTYNFESKIDLFYFDAFSFDSQPLLWSADIFKKIYNSMNNNSILTTYSAKGVIKQNIRTAGFYVKRLKGFAEKWHMLRATKQLTIKN